MFKKLLAFFAAMTVVIAFAAVDVNKATPAELDGIKGIGPVISAKIIDERKKGNFKSWEDFIARVSGIGQANAAKFSAEGLTVSGNGFKGVVAAPASAKKDDKSAAKGATKPASAAASAAPAAAKKDDKPAAKGAAKPASAAASAAPAAPAAAKKDDKPAAKVEAKSAAAANTAAPAKTDVKTDAKADVAKPAASAAKK